MWYDEKNANAAIEAVGQLDDATSTDSSVIDAWSKHEKHSSGGGALRGATNPKRKCLHKFIGCISAMAILVALNMFAGQILGVIIEEVDIVDIIGRIYVILLCVLVVFIEMEWTQFARESMIFHLWVTRGLFYGFIGVLGLEQNEKATSRKGGRISEPGRKYLRVVTGAMLVCGAVYLLMGVACIQLFYKRQRKWYNEQLHAPSEKVQATSVDRAENRPEWHDTEG